MIYIVRAELCVERDNFRGTAVLRSVYMLVRTRTATMGIA